MDPRPRQPSICGAKAAPVGSLENGDQCGGSGNRRQIDRLWERDALPLTAAIDGVEMLVEVVGAFTITRGGLRRTDVLHRALGRAAIQSGYGERPLLLLTTELPTRKSSGMAALAEARRRLFLDVLELGRDASVERLRAYATHGCAAPIGELLGPG